MRRLSIWTYSARLVKLEARIQVRMSVVRAERMHTMVDLSPKLGTHDGGEDFGQDSHPCFFMHNVKLLKSLAHCSG